MSMSSITILPVKGGRTTITLRHIEQVLSIKEKPLKCFTLKHVDHAEEGQGEGGFAAAGPATDPHLEKGQ